MKLTRRRLLQGASSLAAASVLPVRAAKAANPGSSVIGTLSTYMSEAQRRSLPSEVVEKAKHHILDTFAAMVSGSTLAPGRVALEFARAHAGEKIATVAAFQQAEHGDAEVGEGFAEPVKIPGQQRAFSERVAGVGIEAGGDSEEIGLKTFQIMEGAV